jgi:3-phosphoglycerate kinase
MTRYLLSALAALAEIYVNNAFGASHRAHASLAAIKAYLPSYAGLLVESEVKSLNKVINPKKPLISIIGGAKIGTKIRLVEKLSKKSHRILIGGALANNFFVAHKLEVGKSLVDKDSIKFANRFKDKNIILPVDVVVSTKMDGSGKPVVKSVKDDWQG